MSLTERDALETLTATRRYPALLAQLADGAARGDTDALDSRRLLEATLEGGPDASTPDALFDRYLETGELAAARRLARLVHRQQRGDDADGDDARTERDDWEVEPRRRLMAREVEWRRRVEQSLRRVHGRLLMLEGADDDRVAELRREVDELRADERLRADRPGRVAERLDACSDELDEIIDARRRELEATRERLADASAPEQRRDFEFALRRMRRALDHRDRLPLAAEFAAIARRAADGELSDEDLARLHRRDERTERLVRPRSELATLEPGGAGDIADRLRDDDLPALELDESRRRAAAELFETLRPEEGQIDPDPATRALFDFLGIDDDPVLEALGHAASFYRLHLADPRLPTLRRHSLSLAVPHRPGRSAVANLLEVRPATGLPAVYHPGRLDETIRRAFDTDARIAHFDDLDLLRLAELPAPRREHALQQILLPRMPYPRVEPWQLGGPVTGEMFRGRDETLERLRRPRGGTVVFGGRMTGKSSLLERLYREIEGSEQGGANRRAIKVSSAAGELFRPLIDALADLFPERSRPIRAEASRIEEDPEVPAEERADLLATLVRQFLRRDGAELTILVDDADRFAAREARRPAGESVAWTLRDLEFDHPDRLRVVFAGFRTLHRRAVADDGVFANWFGTAEVGRLAPHAARDLIGEPLADLGFRFASRAALERVLDYTARHPMLLHEFAARLVERVRPRRGTAIDEQVVEIEPGDVEAVARDTDLRDRVCQVVRLNLEEAPRLELVVHLILESFGEEPFELAELEETIEQWYGDRFNAYFDDRNVGALVSRLRALGLVDRRPEGHVFAQPVYARRVMADSSFEERLDELLARATDPREGRPRRFPTLPAAQLERLEHVDGRDPTHAVVVGLPNTLRTSVAEGLFGADDREPAGKGGAHVISAAGCRNVAECREVLAASLGVGGFDRSIAEIAAARELHTLAVDDADGLADVALGKLADALSERHVRLVAFGGVPLARTYLERVANGRVEPVRLERLRAEDLRRWGRESGLVFDEKTSERLHEVTAGYFPLVSRFADFLRERRPSADEYFPEPADITRFAETALDAEAVETDLLATLPADARTVLRTLYRLADEQDYWRVEPEVLDELWLDPLTDATDLPADDLHHHLELLRLVDLLPTTDEPTPDTLALDPRGPLATAWRDA